MLRAIRPQPAVDIRDLVLQTRRALGRHGDQVTAVLHTAGFAFDPKDEARTRSQNETRYTVWQLPYAQESGAGEGLRPTIQIELTYAPMRLAPVTLPVRSFVAEAHGRRPEVAQMACVSVTETAAEKAETRLRGSGLGLEPGPPAWRVRLRIGMIEGRYSAMIAGRSRDTEKEGAS